MTGELKEQNSDTIFQDAVDALRRGDKPRAKELLTLLLKSDQNNAVYWIWLSASVDSPKERIYCLQTALKLDPENSTAKRGLILLGALAPDESIQPFPMNRPRAWEEKLLLANEKPKVRVSLFRTPAFRLVGVTLLGLGLCAYVVFGFILPRQSNFQPTQTNTPGPSPTFTATPTLFGATAIPTRVFGGPTPLSAYLPQTYTPTPLYVNTPRSAVSIDQYRIAQDAYKKGDWDAFILNMQLILPLEPESADIYYYIGEAYRFKGESANAIRNYNEALKIDPNFSAPYLGLARARLLSNPNFNAESLFADAIKRDPFYGEAYLERARFYTRRGDVDDAITDLQKAQELLPGSSEVYLALANAYLLDDDFEKALIYAEEAYALDITNLSTYKLLSDLYIQDEDYPRALDALQLYTNYEVEDASGFAKLGLVYYQLGEYQMAVTVLDRAFDLNPRGLRDYYIYRGLSHVELGNGNEAIDDMTIAVDEDDQSFEARLGYARAYYIDEKFGSAFLQVEIAQNLAKTDREKALALYWRAKSQEGRGDIGDAIKSWNDLLKLNRNAMTPEMREEAEARLDVLIPPTATPRGGASSPTVTPVTRTPTSSTPTPTRTRTPTPTP
ncbi:MAG: tetratricopeptide repeat protein [Anaerolineales bacterium]|nr:tetratricopeptide repeat protein [Anaerolineales bacterium]